MNIANLQETINNTGVLYCSNTMTSYHFNKIITLYNVNNVDTIQINNGFIWDDQLNLNSMNKLKTIYIEIDNITFDHISNLIDYKYSLENIYLKPANQKFILPFPYHLTYSKKIFLSSVFFDAENIILDVENFTCKFNRLSSVSFLIIPKKVRILSLTSFEINFIGRNNSVKKDGNLYVYEYN